MQESNKMRDQLIDDFAENYIEKLFYFCLKKTGSSNEAEDLTQDIVLQIISALNKGTIPTSFSAWIWQIARNRYSVWAKNKHNRNESVTGSDISDYEIEDENENLLDKIIHTEQMSLLRRELAFIRSDYRSIIVAYYIEDKSIRDIASSLSLSESAVQQRLHRARIILKEGMDMARDFGKRSYKPDEITFAASGSQPSGLPWSAVQRKIPKNILLEASNNPSTLEELSIELGIALPYMEEEVELLHKATLLEKNGDKYTTNFFILDKECRLEIYHTLRNASKERSRLLREFMDDSLKTIRGLGIAGEHLDDNTIRWWLVPDHIDCLIVDIGKGQDIYAPPKRANGESWGFVGYEITELPEKTITGHNCYGNEVWVYKYGDYSLWDLCGDPEYEETELLSDCIRNKRTADSISGIEKGIWEKINNKYVHTSDSGEVIPDILVITEENFNKIHETFRCHKNYEPLIHNVKETYDKIEKIFKKYSHKVLHDSLGYNVRMELYAMRMMCIHDLVDEGVLTLPEDRSNSTLGMHIILK